MTYSYSPDDPYIAPHFIKGVAFDNDDTLYVEPENAKEIHKLAGYLAVKSYFPNMGEEEYARNLAYSRKEYGGSLEIYTEEHGLDPSELRKMHYKHLIELVTGTDFFDTIYVPHAELDQLRASNIPMIVATHGNMEWTKFSNEKNKLTGYFNDIVTKDHTGINKAAGPEMYHMVLDKFGVSRDMKPEELGIGYAMVEDTAKNLEHAKALGMTTVLIDPTLKTGDKVPEYVDVVAPDNNIAIKIIRVSNALLYAREYDSELFSMPGFPEDYNFNIHDVA